MVAVTGGLFISVIVFAMARQGTRFYQQESRIAEATLAATIGMQRLRADIGRAGYMASPYIATDPNLCTPVSALGSATLLQDLRSIQISSEVDDPVIVNNADLSGASPKIVPDRIQLAGAYQNADRFIAGYLPPAPGAGAAGITIPLQPNIGALVRYRYSSLGNTQAQQDLLNSLFPTGRALRLVNQYGKVAYGIIATTAPNGGPNGNLPVITLDAAPAIPLRGTGATVCEFAGVGVEVNVVNFYQYQIADLQRSTRYDKTLFGQLYASTANPWDANRTELIREELDPRTGTPFLPLITPEIVAEYAVDMRFEVTYADPWPNPTALITTTSDTSNNTGASTVYAVAGRSVDNTTSLPQKVRSVRVRLSVRSRDADRAAAIQGTGLYRLGITPVNGPRSFARVRTLQADVAVPNHFGVNW
jgi:hypothetical protein